MPSNVDHARVAPGAEGVNPNHPAAAHLKILNADEGRVDMGDRKNVAICGFASSSRHLMPFDDPTWIIGAMNQFYRHIPRADYWFDIHKNWREGNVEGTDHPRALAEIGFPVFMTERVADVPNSVRYPVERIKAKFGINYFTSTISYMIAYWIDAIDQKVEARAKATPAVETTNGHAPVSLADAYALVRSLYSEYTIGIYGIDLIVGDEYDFQKACAEFWIAQADARGIHVDIPPQSALLKQRWMYGYESEPDSGLIRISDYKAREKDLVKRLAGLQETYSKTVAEMQTIDGALQEVRHHLTVCDLRSKGGQIPLAAAH